MKSKIVPLSREADLAKAARLVEGIKALSGLLDLLQDDYDELLRKHSDNDEMISLLASIVDADAPARKVGNKRA